MNQLPNIYVAPAEKTSPKFCTAFHSGCHGKIVDGSYLRAGPVALFGSPNLWNIVQEAKQQNRTIFYGDHGYFGRDEYYRITRNAFQHLGLGEGSSKRFEAHDKTIEPWKKRGAHILVAPPPQVNAMLFGFNSEGWIQGVLGNLKAFSNRPVRVRHKAHKPMRKLKAPPTLKEDFEDCWAVVTWRSNVAVEAILAGIPVFCTGLCAAYIMGLSDLGQIESPVYPDNRKQWASVLANNQWTLDEIADGKAWRELQRG